ncbi:MAG: hypothetical protein SGCHY_005388 [Lobulomycetales sp.]
MEFEQLCLELHSGARTRSNDSLEMSPSLKYVHGLPLTHGSERNAALDFSIVSEERHLDFLKLFPNKYETEVPETLIQDFACAWHRDILVQGRIYVSNLALHFYANILGWVHSVSLPLSRISSIEKKAVLGIPNALLVSMDSEETYFFASFLASRDRVLELIEQARVQAPPDSTQLSVFTRSEKEIAGEDQRLAVVYVSQEKLSTYPEYDSHSDDDHGVDHDEYKDSHLDVGVSEREAIERSLSRLSMHDDTLTLQRPSSRASMQEMERPDSRTTMHEIDSRTTIQEMERPSSRMSQRDMEPERPASRSSMKEMERPASRSSMKEMERPASRNSMKEPERPSSRMSQRDLVPERPSSRLSVRDNTTTLERTSSRASLERPESRASAQSAVPDTPKSNRASEDWFTSSIRKIASIASFRSTPAASKQNASDKALLDDLANRGPVLAKAKATSPTGSMVDATFSADSSTVPRPLPLTASPEVSLSHTSAIESKEQQRRDSPPKASHLLLSSILDREKAASLADATRIAPETAVANGIVQQRIKIKAPAVVVQPSTESLAREAKACSCSRDELKQLFEFTVEGADLAQVWRMLFSYDAVKGPHSNFNQFLTSKRKCSEIDISPWENAREPASSSSKEPASPVYQLYSQAVTTGANRKLRYTAALTNPLGPRSTRYLGDETLRNLESGFFCVQGTSSTPDVPSGSSFRTHTLVCVNTAPPDVSPGDVHVAVYYRVEWLKSSWLKMPIEMGVESGMKEYWVDLADGIKEWRLDDSEAGQKPTEPAVVEDPDKDAVLPTETGRIDRIVDDADVEWLLRVARRALLTYRWHALMAVAFALGVQILILRTAMTLCV